MSSAALSFNDMSFDVIDRKGQPWIQSRQLATALGYKDEKSVHKIYERNRNEFTASMIGVVKLTTPLGGEQEVRIFSLRGCHLVAMFARTTPAKGFRVWVLDVIEKFNTTREQQPSLPLETYTVTPDQQCTLQNMVRVVVDKSGATYKAVWSRFNNHFRIARYSQLPQSRMSEAVDYLMRLDMGQRALPEAEPKAPPAPSLKDEWLQAYAEYAEMQKATSASHDAFLKVTSDIKRGQRGKAYYALDALESLLYIQRMLSLSIRPAMLTADALTEG